MSRRIGLSCIKYLFNSLRHLFLARCLYSPFYLIEGCDRKNFNQVQFHIVLRLGNGKRYIQVLPYHNNLKGVHAHQWVIELSEVS